jgi:hypothetical protein
MTRKGLISWRKSYRAAIEEWIAAIRAEEALASVDHEVAEVDKSEAAHFKEDGLRSLKSSTRTRSGRNFLAFNEVAQTNRHARV